MPGAAPVQEKTPYNRAAASRRASRPAGVGYPASFFSVAWIRSSPAQMSSIDVA